MVQSIFVALTYGLLLVAVGWTWEHWQFWCFLGLFWCAERMGNWAGRLQGMVDFIDMSDADQQRIRRAVAEARTKT